MEDLKDEVNGLCSLYRPPSTSLINLRGGCGRPSGDTRSQVNSGGKLVQMPPPIRPLIQPFVYLCSTITFSVFLVDIINMLTWSHPNMLACQHGHMLSYWC